MTTKKSRLGVATASLALLGLLIALLWRGPEPRHDLGGQAKEKGGRTELGESIQTIRESSALADEKRVQVTTEQESHFRGRVTFGQRDSDDNDREVTVYLAAPDAATWGPDGEELQIKHFEIDTEGAISVPALDARGFDCVKNEWAMPIPESPLSVTRVTVNGDDYEITSGHSIQSGASTHLVYVERPRLGRLLVTDGKGRPIPGARLAWTPAPATGGASAALRTLPELSPSLRESGTDKTYRQVPHSAKAIDSQSDKHGYRIPLTNYSRVIWIEADGYAVGSALWTIGVDSRKVSLEQCGSITFRIVSDGPRIENLSLELHVSGGKPLRWQRIASGETISAYGIPEGKHACRVFWDTPGGFLQLAESLVEMEGTQHVDEIIDIGTPPRRDGSVTLEVQLPVRDPEVGLPLRAFIRAAEAHGNQNRPATQVPIRGINAPSGIAAVTFAGLPGGVYEVGVAPLGATAALSLTQGGAERVYFDCSQICEVTAIPVKGDDDEEPPPLDGVTIKWWLDREKGATFRGVVGTEADSSPSRLVNGAFRLSCLPGVITLVPFRQDGTAIGPPSRQRVFAGSNDLTFSIDPGRVARQCLELPWLGLRDIPAVEQALMGDFAFRDNEGAPVRALYCEVLPSNQASIPTGLTAQVGFAALETPVVDCSPLLDELNCVIAGGRFEPSRHYPSLELRQE